MSAACGCTFESSQDCKLGLRRLQSEMARALRCNACSYWFATYLIHKKQYKYSIVAPQDQFLWKLWCVRKMTFLRKNGTEELLLAFWLCLALQTTEQRHLQTLIDKSVTAVTETEFSLSFVLSTLLSMLVYLKSYFVMTCKQVSKLWLLIHWGVKMWSRQCVFITQDSVFCILRAIPTFELLL